ncbi:MAG: F0F1 ATP synthase subunit delta [Proteobacteria bacterium]|nr:F0F1 ATP synthase subunit delta [Pseudomonadota bacterium]MBI3496557.1 F0F1 ATP synthase subunit delta [Pseudomonadota bacterium]
MAAESTGLIAERYASALYDLADTAKALDQLAADLREVKRMVAAAPDLARLIRSPVITRAEQTRALVEIASKAGFHDLTRRFLGAVAGNRRLFALVATIDAFLAELARRRGEMTAEVTSATPLKAPQVEALAQALRSATGSKITVDLKVEPGLIGGLVVRLGSRMVDTSLQTKLKRLQLVMKGTA